MAPTFEKKVSSSYIPDDIVSSILSKLSVKSLNRFSCACKSWSLLFQNPNFFKMFGKNLVSKSHDDDDDTCFLFNWLTGPVKLSFLSGDKFEKEVKLTPPPPFLIQQYQQHFVSLIRILGSSVNGTLCMYDIDDHTKVVLWNPVTDNFNVIPPSNHPEFLPHVTDKFCLHGFGYDHVSDDYKVIRHVKEVYMGDVRITLDSSWEVYSLRSNSWRKLNVNKKIRSNGYEGTEVYLNGVCHWVGKIDDDDDVIYVMSFNFSNDVFFTTPIDLNDDSFFKLVVLNGYVAMISNEFSTKSCKISILGEIGVKESWTRLFHVGPLSPLGRPIGAGKKGNIFFRNFVGQLAWFDLTTGVFQKGNDKETRFIGQIIVYKKNLCPIGGMNN